MCWCCGREGTASVKSDPILEMLQLPSHREKDMIGRYIFLGAENSTQMLIITDFLHTFGNTCCVDEAQQYCLGGPSEARMHSSHTDNAAL